MRSLKFVAAACRAEIVSGLPETKITGVCLDSRTAKAGDLFFAIKGEKFDGHDFVAEVAVKNVAAVVVEKKQVGRVTPCVPLSATLATAGRGLPALPCPLLAVADVRAALGNLAAAYRREFDLPVIAVGGSNGKTTVKELVASVLRQKFATLWSEASFNNDIGVPMTLLRLENTHQAAVLEAGTNHPGELAPLVKMIAPKFGIITSIGREHLEFFGDVAGVAQEEGALAELLPADGILFLRGDCEWSERIAERTKAQVRYICPSSAGCDWGATKIRLSSTGTTFFVNSRRKDYEGEYKIKLLGEHSAINALFAIAVGAELGLTREEIQRGLAGCQPAKMRLNLWEANGVRVLDDCYNANADSTVAALETLCGLPLQGRRVAVLGDMAELGAHSVAAHAEVGRRAAELELGQLFAIGQMAAVTGQAARAAGLMRVFEFAEVEAALKVVRSFVKPGDVVLLKASRAARLERIAEMLKAEK
jgi:UDP-N-acetylmuramoyl-tripeptide--D-alanyl-D-alanine ligase